MALNSVRDIYRQFDPNIPLMFGDPRYVDCEEARGSGNLVTRLENAFCFADTPQHLLLAGQRGSGKTTELIRLIERLNQKGFFVVYFEADAEDLDVNDVQFVDLLLAIIRQVGNALRERAKIDLRPSKLTSFWDRLNSLVGSEIKFDKQELAVGFPGLGRLTATIKGSPNAREEIRRVLEPSAFSLIQAINEMLDEAVTRLKQKGFEDLVILVDNLDRIVLRDQPNDLYNTHEELFIHRGTQLTQLHAHVVYTIPTSLILSPRASTLRTTFGRISVLPLVRLSYQNTQLYYRGRATLEALVTTRLIQIGLSPNDVFSSQQVFSSVCQMSGGNFRTLFNLIREICVELKALPILESDVERAVQALRNDFARMLTQPHYMETLQKIDQSHTLTGESYDSLLLESLAVMEYEENGLWYAVNPIVSDLVKEKIKLRKPVKAGS